MLQTADDTYCEYTFHLAIIRDHRSESEQGGVSSSLPEMRHPKRPAAHRAPSSSSQHTPTPTCTGQQCADDLNPHLAYRRATGTTGVPLSISVTVCHRHMCLSLDDNATSMARTPSGETCVPFTFSLGVGSNKNNDQVVAHLRSCFPQIILSFRV